MGGGRQRPDLPRDPPIPKLGYGLGFLRDPAKRLWLLGVPALLLGLFELVRIWRPERPAPGSPEPT